MPFGQHIADDGGLNLREQTRCKGNFARKLYDGFGQFFQEQSPRQGWETTQHGFSPVENRLETVVDYD
ncbi:MAG: hypothetical protein OXF62_21940 [Caldilineaceae bacterium]|nr:hypothetical protein [Caldilineaceae bacterium]